MRSLLRISVLMLCMIWSESMQAQELEPRSLTNIPVGMNSGVMGYVWSQGNILVDPALSIEDLNANVHGLVAGYLRSINVFGKSGKIDVVLPFATGNWSGSQNQEYRQTSRTGIGDPRIRFSVNLLGAPALNKEGFQIYQQKTIFGVNVMVSMPLGQYLPDRLINLGSNRFTIRPQVGVSHSYEKWFF